MATVIKMPDRHFVRFFDETIECPDCEKQTSGYVYEGSGAVICHVCQGVLIEFEANPEPDPKVSVLFFSEMDFGESE